jgi:hypothetical protein
MLMLIGNAQNPIHDNPFTHPRHSAIHQDLFPDFNRPHLVVKVVEPTHRREEIFSDTTRINPQNGPVVE